MSLLFLFSFFFTFLLSNPSPSLSQQAPSFTSSDFPWRPTQKNKILVSRNNVFAAGFNPTPSSPNHYVFSIWYHNIPGNNKTIIWSANPNSPVTGDFSLDVDDNGALRLIDSSGKDLWPRSSSETGMRRITRDFPPSHFLFKVEAFTLLVKTGVEKYESDVFEASGHKWRLSLYPNGDNKSNGSGFISLYLVIEETENLPHTWEVNVSFRLFVLDQIRDKYLTVEDGDGAVKRFHWMKTEWGFAQLISIESFNDTSNGYLVGDCCIFGAEVFTMERNCKWECLSMIKEPDDNTIIFKMENFSKLDKKYYESYVHTIGDSKWKLTVYPRGNVKFKGKALSVFLELVEADKLPPKRKVYAEYKLRVRNQINDNHMEFSVERWFSSTSVNWGYPQFMTMKVLHDPSKGYIVHDSLIVEAEISLISKVKRLS